jgi:hypothetical protein
MALPRISCLLYTTIERAHVIGPAVSDFRRQTWEDRELVIVVGPGAAPANFPRRNLTEAFAGDDQVVVVAFDDDEDGLLSEPERRNRGLRAATGQLVCEWSDQARHHPQRLACQFDELDGESTIGSGLVDFLVHSPLDCQLWWVDGREGGVAPNHGLQSGTLLYWLDSEVAYPRNRPGVALTPLEAMLEVLLARGTVRPVADKGYLLVRRLIGTRAAGQRLRALVRRKALPEHVLVERRGLLERELGVLGYPPGRVTVRSYRGDAFTLEFP